MLADTAVPSAPAREVASVVPIMAKLLRKLDWIITPFRFRRRVNSWASIHPMAVSTTALFLALTCRLYRRYGSLNLDVILMRARRERPAED